MKTKFLSSLLVLILVSVICSCSSKPDELLSGKWQMTGLESSAIDRNDVNVQNYVQDLIKSTSAIYNADFSYEQTVNSITTKGKWTILADGKQLQVVDESGKKTIMGIIELTSDRLVLSNFDDGAETKQIFSKVK